MAEVSRLRQWKLPKHNEVTLGEVRASMLDAMALADNPKTSPDMLQHITNEWMFASAGSAWPLWQSLALNKRTPALVLRQLHEKRLWYLDILIVQHHSAPDDIIEWALALPKEIVAAHKTYKGYDKNRELRAHARKWLGMPLEDEEEES